MKRCAAIVSVIGCALAALVAQEASAVTRGFKLEDFSNAAWQQVPNTFLPEEGSAHIDLKTLQREGDLVVYDVVVPDGQYGRNAANCQTQQTRTLRLGGFETPSVASYKDLNYPWGKSSEYQTKLLEFACTISQEENNTQASN